MAKASRDVGRMAIHIDPAPTGTDPSEPLGALRPAQRGDVLWEDKR